MDSAATTPEATARPTIRRWAVLLEIVLLVALPIRIYLCMSAAMISRDGVGYIWYAQQLACDPLTEMRKQSHHPLFPAMVLGTHKIVNSLSTLPGLRTSLAWTDPVLSWQMAGMTVSLLGGLFAVVGAYALTTSVFDHQVGLVAAAMTAALADLCQLSADVLTDMPHLAVYLFGLACAVRGLRNGRIGWLTGAGILSGIAYLIRPEGAEVGVVACAGALLLRPDWVWRKRLAGGLAVALAAALVASPYMLVTGKLVQKKSIERLMGAQAHTGDRGRTGPLASGVLSDCTFACGVAAEPTLIAVTMPVPLRAIGIVAEKYLRSLRGTFLIPAVAWLAWRRLKRSDRRLPECDPVGSRLVASAFVLHLLIVLSLIVRFDYWDLFSMRHVVILAALTLPWSAAGLVAICGAAHADRRQLAGIALAIAMVAPTLPWMLERRYADEVYLRQAGEWIRADFSGRARVLTTRHPVAFYANGVHVWSPLDANIPAILAWIRDEKPDYVVFDVQRMLKMSPTFFADLQAALRQGESLTQAKVTEQLRRRRMERAIVYRYKSHE